jgi:hypothetical protein
MVKVYKENHNLEEHRKDTICAESFAALIL